MKLIILYIAVASINFMFDVYFVDRILSSISWSVYQTNWTRVSSSWLVVWTLTGFIEELRQCQCQCNTYGIYMYCHHIVMSNVTVIVYCALGWKQLYCSIQKVFGISLCHCITYL